MFALKNQTKTVLETMKGLQITETIKIRLGIYISGFLMKKSHEPNPVFRLASLIPTLMRERGCECLQPQEAGSGQSLCCRQQLKNSTAWEAFGSSPSFTTQNLRNSTDCGDLSHSTVPNFPQWFGCCIRKQLFLTAKRAPSRGEVRLSELLCSKLPIPSTQVWFQGRFTHCN